MENSVSDSDILDYDFEESDVDETDNSSNQHEPQLQYDTATTVSCADNANEVFEIVKSDTFPDQPQDQNLISLSVAHPAGLNPMLIRETMIHQNTVVQGPKDTYYIGYDLGVFTNIGRASPTINQILGNCDFPDEQNGTSDCANNSINNLVLNFSANNNTNIVTHVFRAESHFENTSGSMGFFYRDPDMPLLERIRPLETSAAQQQDADDDFGGAPTLDYYGPSTDSNPEYFM